MIMMFSFSIVIRYCMLCVLHMNVE